MTRIAHRLVLAATLVVLAGCAGAPKPVATLTPGCDAGAANSGVVVTARGTRLALRAAPVEPRLQRASLDSRAGGAVLSCRPSDGVLRKCVVLYEEPGGEGYGKRALAIADRVIWPSDVERRDTAEVRFRFDNTQAARLCR